MNSPDLTPQLQHARQPVIDAIAQAFALYGWPEITGRLFSQLFLDGHPRSQDELTSLLGVSKATVSTNLRTLEALHLVHRVASPNPGEGSESGGRPRVYFQAERDFMKVAQELLRHNARREIELVSRGLEESRRRLSALSTQANGADEAVSAAIQDDLAAIDKIEGYQRWGQRLLWMLQSAERMQRFVTGFWRTDDEGMSQP